MINLKTKKIVVPYDFSKTAENAVEQAAFIAAFTKGELFLAFVQKKNDLLNMLLPSLNIKKPSTISDLLSEKLTTEAQRISKKHGIKVTPIFSTGNITTELINLCNEVDANLIVMGTQGGDSNNDLFMGSNTYRTLTKSELPILTVRSASDKKGYSNIALPIDLSAHTRQKVNVAIQLAKLFTAHVHVIGMYNNNEEVDKFKLEVYIKQIEKECEKSKVAVTSSISKTDNKVKKTIAFAKKVNADILISMTDQDTEFKSALLGNYIHQLINNSKIPVLCLQPELSEMSAGGTAGIPF
jgi:nucleotide-binding universal stress UspA family protein